jgi:hypothetical protein
MSDGAPKQPSGRGTILWTVCLAAAALALYVTAYLLAARVHDEGYAISRIYGSSAVSRLFIPAAWMEARLCRKHVYLQTVEDDSDVSHTALNVEYYAEP